MSNNNKANGESRSGGMTQSAPSMSDSQFRESLEAFLGGGGPFAPLGDVGDYPITPWHTTSASSDINGLSNGMGPDHKDSSSRNSPALSPDQPPLVSEAFQPGLITQRLGIVNNFASRATPYQPPACSFASMQTANQSATARGGSSRQTSLERLIMTHHHESGGSASADSSLSQPCKRTGTTTDLRKRQQAPVTSSVSEDEGDHAKRRRDRNNREQQRSHQITHQINELGDLLKDANVHFKPDKFSILVNIADYIKSLQQQSASLEVERKKILDTITEASEILSNQYIASSTDDHVVATSHHERAAEYCPPAASTSTPSPTFVQGIDFQSLFYSSPFPCSITSIDGRFMDCNDQFEEVTGYGRAQLMPSEEGGDGDSLDGAVSSMTGSDSSETSAAPPSLDRNMSLFNLLDRDDMTRTFTAMSTMLKRPITTSDPTFLTEDDTWTDMVQFSHPTTSAFQVRLSLSLVRSPDGIPRFFSCVAIPMSSTKSRFFG